MQIQVAVHDLEHQLLMRIEIDDQQTVRDLREIVESKVDASPTQWDLTFSAHRMALDAPLCEYGVEDQSTLWIQPRQYGQPVEAKPLTLLIKQIGTERTTQMKFSTEYTIGRCKHEIEATLEKSTGTCYLTKHGELEDLDDDKTLGHYEIRDWATLDFGYERKVGKVTRAKEHVVSGVKNYAHAWKFRNHRTGPAEQRE